MDTEAQAVPGAPLPVGRFTGRQIFEQTIRDAFVCAAREGWKEIFVSDASFSDWPLREQTVVESLQAWARQGHRFVMLATRFDELQRYQARFVDWRQTWSHLVECRQCRQADPADFPSAIWSSAWVMQRHQVEHSVFVCDTHATRKVALRQVLEEWVRQSTPGFPASTLGL